jgi:hypothetical protein
MHAIYPKISEDHDLVGFFSQRGRVTGYPEIESQKRVDPPLRYDSIWSDSAQKG